MERSTRAAYDGNMFHRRMKNPKKISKSKVKKTILVHSADHDLVRSLSTLLQDQYGIIATESVEALGVQRNNKRVSLLVIDLERTIPALLTEFECRRLQNMNAPIIVLYAYRQGQPELEKKIRQLTNQVLYKPAPIDQILTAISAEIKLHSFTL